MPPEGAFACPGATLLPQRVENVTPVAPTAARGHVRSAGSSQSGTGR